mmetsp:Transcript_47857/g.138399  ORF Transcript_47857/g.138399 Transcript_47857/m.138399 type:complete len:219 (-) Transcript_47857:70-726(-)
MIMKTMVYAMALTPRNEMRDSAERSGKRQIGKRTNKVMPPSTAFLAQSAAGAPKPCRIVEKESATTMEKARQEKTVLTVQAQVIAFAQRGPLVDKPSPLKLRSPVLSHTRPYREKVYPEYMPKAMVSSTAGAKPVPAATAAGRLKTPMPRMFFVKLKTDCATEAPLLRVLPITFSSTAPRLLGSKGLLMGLAAARGTRCARGSCSRGALASQPPRLGA